jgi:hypothetical protein|eukprot:COSAG01_NODE_2794_length_7059_cov_28.564080_6_plen_108_part_00
MFLSEILRRNGRGQMSGRLYRCPPTNGGASCLALLVALRWTVAKPGPGPIAVSFNLGQRHILGRAALRLDDQGRVAQRFPLQPGRAGGLVFADELRRPGAVNVYRIV